jgi:hypothetical protein
MEYVFQLLSGKQWLGREEILFILWIFGEIIMGRPKGVKNGEGHCPKGRQCQLDRSRKMAMIKKGLLKPDEYSMSPKEAWEKAGLVWTQPN